MTEEKARYSTAPADLNELKARVEERGTDWNEALARLKEATGGKDLATAMREGWSVEDFWKFLEALIPGTKPVYGGPSCHQRELDEAKRRAKKQQAEKEKSAEPDPAPAPQDNHFTEAPASFNVKAISPQGFDVMLTLRDTNATQLWERAQTALDWLAKKGFTPTPARSGPRGGDVGGNGPNAGNGDKPKYCTHKSDGPGFCPTHGKELKQSKHHPGYYCPAKI